MKYGLLNWSVRACILKMRDLMTNIIFVILHSCITLYSLSTPLFVNGGLENKRAIKKDTTTVSYLRIESLKLYFNLSLSILKCKCSVWTPKQQLFTAVTITPILNHKLLQISNKLLTTRYSRKAHARLETNFSAC